MSGEQLSGELALPEASNLRRNLKIQNASCVT